MFSIWLLVTNWSNEKDIANVFSNCVAFSEYLNFDAGTPHTAGSDTIFCHFFSYLLTFEVNLIKVLEIMAQMRRTLGPGKPSYLKVKYAYNYDYILCFRVCNPFGRKNLSFFIGKHIFSNLFFWKIGSLLTLNSRFSFFTLCSQNDILFLAQQNLQRFFLIQMC